jgi:hypothetical protein
VHNISRLLRGRFAPRFRSMALATISVFLLLNPIAVTADQHEGQGTERRISVREYRDKMMAGWIGQMVGVGWGAPTEFRWKGEIIPADAVPQWNPGMVNQYGQDDLYVEMTFVRSMDLYGFDVSANQAGIDFANTGFMLWAANDSGRKNLREGIAPPNSGHPQFNNEWAAIDYQIEADYSGIIAPGLPNTVIELGEKFGRIMNYGDGVYGGQFVGGMYAEAFFEDNPRKVVEAGLKCIPADSRYAEAVRDVIQWHDENPDNWEATWLLLNKKYHENEYRGIGSSNIDAVLNGAYIVMGLLYGDGDIEKTTVIAMRCGQDSDCNPSNAAGVLFATLGYSKLPDRFISGLDRENTNFSYTDYNFTTLIDVSEKLAREAVVRAGGSIESSADGDVFVIPVVKPTPGPYENGAAPGPISDNEFSRAESGRISGSKILRYSLLLLALGALLVLKENRSIKAATILVPMLLIYLIVELLISRVPMAVTGALNYNLTSPLQSLSVGIAILLLLGERIKSLNCYTKSGIAAVVVIFVGIAGIRGPFDGTYIAATVSTMGGFIFEAIAWLAAIGAAAWMAHKVKGRLAFNGVLLLSLIVAHIVGIFLVSRLFGFNTFGGALTTSLLFVVKIFNWTVLGAANMYGYGGAAMSFGNILVGAVGIGVILYIITLGYLGLSYVVDTFDERISSWTGSKYWMPSSNMKEN